MNDDDLVAAYETLSPEAPQRRRIDARVSAWLEAGDTPLAVEWLQLVRVSPLAAFGLGSVSAVSIALTPPFVWLARALF